MYAEMIQAIAQGFTIVTPNKRFARVLQTQYIKTQLAQQKQVWETADVLPWAAYVQRLWQQTAPQDSLILLNTPQQRLVWQQIIEQSTYSKELLQTSAIALQAYTSLQKLRQWGLEVFPAECLLNQDQKAFRAWMHSYQKECASNGWLDSSNIESILIGLPLVPVKLYLIGFDAFTPLQKELLAELEKVGSEIKKAHRITTRRNHVIRCEFEDSQAEINALAHWIRAQLQYDPKRSIGVVVADLASIRKDLINTLDDVLVPSKLFVAGSYGACPYNITLGEPLIDHPLLHTALNILRLKKQEISLQHVSELLRTSFITCATSEACSRAHLDASLREYGQPIITLTVLQQYLKKDIWQSLCPKFIDGIRKYQEKILPVKQSHLAWSHTFVELLTTLAWPGERPLNSDEYQALLAWGKTLEQFVSLDIIDNCISYNEALSQLQQCLRGRIHQAGAVYTAPVQIMGLLESTGIQFDALWVMGLHGDSWPTPVNVDPFIPIALQMQENMPHATPQYELEYARRITQRLVIAAENVIFSLPLSVEDQALRPSTLLKQYPLEQIEQSECIDYAAVIFNSGQSEYLNDQQGPKVDDVQMHGGSGLFKDQAACPFKAFATYRLAAKSLKKVDIGLNHAQRGQLIHECLKLFWQAMHTQQELLNLPDEKLNRSIESAVASAIKKIQGGQAFYSFQGLLNIEHKRLCTILRQWLDVEKERSSFSVIETEQKHSCQIAGLEITVCIDRIDQLADGSLVIIDYKTGVVNIADWFEERMQEPQLPIYAVTIEGNIFAIAFAQIGGASTKFIGLSQGGSIAEEHFLPNIQVLSDFKYAKGFQDWHDLLQNWQQKLSVLVAEFQRGEARIAPYKGLKTCRYCDLGSLCRIQELDLLN
ncbi:RecB family exonuclease [uncultured Candidatus Thioglobus sp.]|nr:RecB family exonuclease [uncultured Candidatus Thioglobus sp.]